MREAEYVEVGDAFWREDQAVRVLEKKITNNLVYLTVESMNGVSAIAYHRNHTLELVDPAKG